jgi:hypothetical protein
MGSDLRFLPSSYQLFTLVDQRDGCGCRERSTNADFR